MGKVVTVENLSKSYVLRHQNTQRYTALRDVITDKVKSVFSGSSVSSSTKEEFWALNDVSFEINQGDRVGIIGRNGAGKSTLLKILSRIVTPTKGRITIDGRVASLLEVGTGFHPELTGRENIFLNGSILGMGKNEIQKKFDEIVAFSEVERFLDTPVKRYSSGMYVRLAFAVAAHLEPEILVVDEVLAVGDAEFQKKCLGKMKDVAGEGRTILFVSHNMAAIQNLCDKALVLKKGKVDFPAGDVSLAVKHYMKSAQENSKVDLESRTDRQGQGNMKIMGFEMLDNEGQLLQSVITGQSVKFRIRYRGNSDSFSNVTAGIAIYGDDGILYSLLGNEFSMGVFNKAQKEGTITCSIEKLPIVSGTYFLNLTICQNGIIEDWIQEAVTIEIEDGDFYGTGKLVPTTHRSVLIPNKWSIE